MIESFKVANVIEAHHMMSLVVMSEFGDGGVANSKIDRNGGFHTRLQERTNQGCNGAATSNDQHIALVLDAYPAKQSQQAFAKLSVGGHGAGGHVASHPGSERKAQLFEVLLLAIAVFGDKAHAVEQRFGVILVQHRSEERLGRITICLANTVKGLQMAFEITKINGFKLSMCGG